MANEVITVNPADIEAADWLAKRAELVERGKSITSVTTNEELEVAGKFETDCKKLVKKLADIRKGITGWIPIFVLLVSAILMGVCGILIKKCGWKWLETYAMSISMLGAMVFAVVITPVLS